MICDPDMGLRVENGRHHHQGNNLLLIASSRFRDLFLCRLRSFPFPRFGATVRSRFLCRRQITQFSAGSAGLF
ncbi:hypothetical protein PR202_gb14670 [Eleusine coracana subsp. coracana]|uniref:Uncharacterized protein n=1 Tax=Eleusine coracana subsp. coracana TaxID=191504 RepID=A0AAV5EX09_ELECO|nr:hypothetical protein PR202_gb14670 [Eleusine coracana subsp. coracana]